MTKDETLKSAKRIIQQNEFIFRRLAGEYPDAESIPPEYVDKITEAIALLAEPAGYLKGTYEGYLLYNIINTLELIIKKHCDE